MKEYLLNPTKFKVVSLTIMWLTYRTNQNTIKIDIFMFLLSFFSNWRGPSRGKRRGLICINWICTPPRHQAHAWHWMIGGNYKVISKWLYSQYYQSRRHMWLVLCALSLLLFILYILNYLKKKKIEERL